MTKKAYLYTLAKRKTVTNEDGKRVGWEWYDSDIIFCQSYDGLKNSPYGNTDQIYDWKLSGFHSPPSCNGKHWNYDYYKATGERPTDGYMNRVARTWNDYNERVKDMSEEEIAETFPPYVRVSSVVPLELFS